MMTATVRNVRHKWFRHYEVLSDGTRRASYDRQMQSQAVLREVPRIPAASTLHRPATVASAKVHGDTLGYGLVWQTVLRMTTAHSPELASVVKHLEIDLPKNFTGGLQEKINCSLHL